MGKRISTLIQSSFNMNVTREPVNKGFQTQVKGEKKEEWRGGEEGGISRAQDVWSRGNQKPHDN